MKQSRSQLITKAMLNWYRNNSRDLPWRRTHDPYKIWVSEIMLQQTQVDTVISYYERWMETFPTIRHLAKAPLEKVLKAWEGLGYYSRARSLHKAAQHVVSELNERIPRIKKELIALPGIGAYTAGAILSIAFNQAEPVVDGNVVRVLSRLFRIERDVQDPKTIAMIWDCADQLVPDKYPGDFNQSLMDLGAMICLPKKPQCLLCPIASFCQAKASGAQEQLPIKTKKTKVQSLEKIVALVEDKGKLLIRQRPSSGLLGGLWEFPETVRKGNENIKKALRRAVKEQHHLDIEFTGELPAIKHLYTHRHVTFLPYYLKSGAPKKIPRQTSSVKWVTLESLKRYPISVAHQKIVKALKTHQEETAQLALKI